jgi:hypothetical protein
VPSNICGIKRSAKGLLAPANCVVTIIGLQPQMLFGVRNFDHRSMINNDLVLTKAARLFDVPGVLSSVETKGLVRTTRTATKSSLNFPSGAS